MTTDKNINFVKDLYAAFNRGDLPYILERFAPEMGTFGVMAAGSNKASWHFIGQRREDVGRYFEQLMGALEPISLAPTHYAAADDYVYATLDHAYKVRKNGKTLSFKNGFHRFKLKGGLVVEWIASEDTQLTAESLA